MERFHVFGLLGYLYLKDFLKYKCELYLKQPLTPTECKIIVIYRTSNHRLDIETKQWGNARLCHFCSYNTIGNESHFVLECPNITPFEISFHQYLIT